jgi:hypothetical protein
MSQPKWKIIANLGDIDPLDEGGYFIFVDKTGVYTPEGRVLEVTDICRKFVCLSNGYQLDVDDDEYIYSDKNKKLKVHEEIIYEEYTVMLEKCTFINGILSDNKYHTDMEAWFADKISEVAKCVDKETSKLIDELCSDDIIIRAQAYRDLYLHFGLINFDESPYEFTRKEAKKRYKEAL